MKKLFSLMSLIIICSHVHAGPREIAWKLHNRIAGVPPTQDVLDDMTNTITQGDPEAAAKIAMENPAFYNVTLKNWIKPWSNRDQTPRVPMNDYVATILGVIRDDSPFDKILYDDVIYIIDNAALPVYSNTDNNH